MSQSIAIEAQDIVLESAKPIPAGKNVAWQMREACRHLGYNDGHWRVRAAWYGEAGSWSAAALEDLRSRYEKWKARQASLADAEQKKLATLFTALAKSNGSDNAGLDSKDVDRIVAMARRLSVDG
jgi:hypothetical protein